MGFCTNCGNQLEDGLRFCQECGQEAGNMEKVFKDSSKEIGTGDRPQNNSSAKNGMRKIVPQIIEPCEGEKEVKQYHCTHLKSRLLSFKAEGVLQVTNKRAIFRASGKSISGNSIIQSEVPIEDISGISLYKGTYFSLKHFILAVLAFLIINPAFTAILSIFSFANTIDRASSSSNSVDLVNILRWILAIAGVFGIFAIPRKYIWNPIFGGMASICIFMISGSSFLSDFSKGLLDGNQGYEAHNNLKWMAVLGVITLIYTIVAIFLYARRLTMSISIGSKGGSSTPIYISGLSGFGFANSAAPKALEAEPTDETEALIRELGAMIMDIQKLGDYGIDKWMRK